MKSALKLGDLEIATLEAIWARGQTDARELHARFGESRGISLSTVQSTLERLHKKCLLAREKISHAYVYVPAQNRDAVIARLVRETLQRFSDVGSNDWDGVCKAVSAGLEE